MSESPPTDITGDDLAESLAAIDERSPLVQHLTNEVTMNDVANLTLHWDALPVMADSPGDAGEMAAGASAILFNTGQVPAGKVEAMHEAAETAAANDIPVVLDPVGVGSTPTRESVAEELLEAVDFAVIKGNYGEISALAGVEAEVKGVESVGEYNEIEDAARSLAESTGATVVASGVADVVATGAGVVRLTAGHEMLGQVVGTGCMLGGTIAAFHGALEDATTAALHGTLAFGIAGERAAELDYNGPASYATNFHDAVAGLDAETAAALDLSERLESVESVESGE
ncbi:hydroxyethylthiazole kinase [Natronolimnohabitans innermongolicus]|uniref:Hydroxyethylthiazole kinase n=1 Tax=Natronolimnohabitans innermongolicus JCM 12255 TaxID=1227499 RepID=L9X240_9EURY|nr:hydroxyethylthiazole kinase [Natronolimnohabitans innermongolicus]ELY55839.1 hydroxyethylthiazole kinase [Natronolimnohabitans innermongolicus JCM 12255]